MEKEEQVQLMRNLVIESGDNSLVAPSTLKYMLRCIWDNMIEGSCIVPVWKLAQEILLSNETTYRAIGELRQLGLIDAPFRPGKPLLIKINWDRLRDSHITFSEASQC